MKFSKETCAQVHSYLDSYLNDELLVETIHDIQRHLAGCRNCAEELEARRRVKTLLRRAVMRETAPAALREKIQEQIRAQQPVAGFSFPTFSSTRMALAACVLAALCLGVWSVVQMRNGEQIDLDVALSEQTQRVFNIGLSDHIHCALDHEVQKDFFSFAHAPAAIRPEYAELISSIRRQVGDEGDVAAHNCIVDGREFIHIVLRRGETVLSLVMTKESGEGFEQAAHVASFDARGAPLYHGQLQNFAVAGFATPSHLAFVVSNLPENENLQFAANVAPSVRGFLAKLEVGA